MTSSGERTGISEVASRTITSSFALSSCKRFGLYSVRSRDLKIVPETLSIAKLALRATRRVTAGRESCLTTFCPSAVARNPICSLVTTSSTQPLSLGERQPR
jgi:hypothetical protein